MHRSIGFVVAASICVAAAGSAGAEEKAAPLSGQLYIAGKTPIDPPPGEPKASHAYVTITGAAAMRVYRAMNAREGEDACKGGRMKEAGSLSCTLSKNGRNATCEFSIDVTKGTLEDGRAC